MAGRKLLSAFSHCRSGNVAVIFAVSIIPLFGAIGIGLDFARGQSLKNELQKASDAAAMQMIIASHEKRSLNIDRAVKEQITSGVSHDNVEVDGTWIAAGKRYRVVTRAEMPTTFASVIMPNMDVSTVAAAELITQGVEVQLETASMEPEAGDYNELYAYCFKPQNGGQPAERLGPINKQTGQRMPFIKIADNSPEGLKSGVQHTGTVLCGLGETVSIQMRNVRNARTDPSARDRNATYNYYTDTTEKNGRVEFNTQPDKMIETIYCKTKDECTQSRSQGGLIPDRETDRDPLVNTDPCTDGYMYMGWEDRPPGIGQWTDRDYDDIRIVMSCHRKEDQAHMLVRLVE